MFESQPIFYGDFMKMGADPADRMYEELTDMNKLQTILNDVRTPYLLRDGSSMIWWGEGGVLPALVPSCVGHVCHPAINLLDYCKVLLDYCI